MKCPTCGVGDVMYVEERQVQYNVTDDGKVEWGSEWLSEDVLASWAQCSNWDCQQNFDAVLS